MPSTIQKPDKPTPKEKERTIIVNGREKTITEKKLSFVRVIELAYGTTDVDGNIAYTVTYKRGENQKPKGVMVKGDTVNVNPGMIFNVTATDKS